MDKYSDSRKAVLKLVKRVFKMTWKQLTLGDANKDNELSLTEMASVLAPYCRDNRQRNFAVRTVFNLVDGGGVDRPDALHGVDGYAWLCLLLLDRSSTIDDGAAGASWLVDVPPERLRITLLLDVFTQIHYQTGMDGQSACEGQDNAHRGTQGVVG